MNVKERLSLASEYIGERRFTEAKAILVQLDHPIAHKWLAQLDDFRHHELPTKPHPIPRRRIHPYLMVAFALTLVSIGILASVWFVLRPPNTSHVMQLTADAFNTEAAIIQNTNIPPILFLDLTPTEDAP